MVHKRISDEYIHLALMYTTDNIFPVLPIKNLVNQYGEPTTPYKLTTGTKPSVSNLCFLFWKCVVQKATAHVNRKMLNIRHKLQEGFQGTFIVITQHQKWCLIYVPSNWK